MDIEELLDGLNGQQRDIVVSEENLLVKACPGSGKTRTLTYKLMFESMKNPLSLKKLVAITYTKRAANEIEERLDRLGANTNNVWAGTIHQFCLEYIIRPYQMYSEKVCKGYTIIDEYVRMKYLKEISEEQKLDLPGWELGKIDTGLDANMEIRESAYPKIVAEYHKYLSSHKEIDFDLILNIAYSILTMEPFIKKNIAGIIRGIYIDEYQDTNELQYYIIGTIAGAVPDIKVLIVGDLDQAIYGTLGGVAKPKKEIEVLFNKRFVEKSITGCYRSTQRIIDYYMHFQITPFRITSKATYALEHGRVCYSLNYSKDEIYSVIAEVIKNKLQEGVPENEICVVAPQWELLFPISRKMRELLPNVSFDAPDITPIKYEEFNVFYKIARLTFTPVGKKISLRKRLATEILDILENDYHIHISENIDCYSILKTIAGIKIQSTKGTEYLDQAITKILKMLNIRLSDYSELSKTYADYFEKIADRMQRYSLLDDIEIFKKTFQEKEGVVVTSCYKVKGEEYDTVISYGLLEGKIPHWEAIYADSQFAKNEAKKMLYVIASRAKRNLFMFSESGRRRRSGEYEPTEILRRYSFAYDPFENSNNI